AYAGWHVIGGDLTIGTMVAFIAYIDRLYNPLRRLVNSSTTLTQSVASMDRVFELLDEGYDITDRPGASVMLEAKGKVEFYHVRFRYEEEAEDVLKGINLTVRPGDTVAFVGMSGGGKSTIISLIPRFYDVTGGGVRIDGKDIRDVTVQSLRKNIGIV